MNVAPKIYEEDFYRQELDHQKKRLVNLKSRQVNRQSRFEDIRNIGRPSTASRQQQNDAATKGRAPRDERREHNIEDAVVRALNDDTLELPCTLDAFVDRLENKPHHGDVAAILRSLCKREHKDKKEQTAHSLSVELKDADNTKRMVIVAVHRTKEEEASPKRQRKE